MGINRTEKEINITLFSLGLERDKRYWIYQLIIQRENRHTYKCCSTMKYGDPMNWTELKQQEELLQYGDICIILQRRRALLPACDCCLTIAGHLLYLFNSQLLPATLFRNAFRQNAGFYQ